MPAFLWLLLAVVLLVVIGYHITNSLIQMLFYILALVVAVAAVWRLIG